MDIRRNAGIVLLACILSPLAVARAGQGVAPGCEKIAAVMDQSGGSLSADEVASKTSTDVETVRNCMDQWRAGMKDKPAPKDANAAGQKMAPGCAKIVAVLDQNSGLSADEVATKTSTDVETVRSCTDLWRRTMKTN
ncbi:MAG TPA: hypothetical protein VMS22_05980 [Candidatus Eisenbacteria bacterium]|nr:hypothetical protein [Candidatus Eisenbacteria bacterium]